jgi:hypothetical protein
MFSQSVTAATAEEAQQQAEKQVHESLQMLAPLLERQYQLHTHAVFAGHLENLKVGTGA